MELRIDAAKAAIRFERPALAAIDMTTAAENVTYVVSGEPLSREEREAQWEAKFCRPPETEH